MTTPVAIKPGEIKSMDPNWKTVNHRHIQSEYFWSEPGILSIPISYGGGYEHPFKASILDTSSKIKQCFKIFLEDQIKNDRCKMIVNHKLYLDLNGYAGKETRFKIFFLNNGEISLEGFAKPDTSK